MGEISEAVFRRAELPSTVIIRAGGYYPERSQMLLDQFDSYEPLTFEWCPYSYAKYREQEFLVIFNVYGGAVTLEVLRILEEGGVQNVLFIGSMFSKNYAIGQFVIITEVVDRAGLVHLVSTDNTGVTVNPETIRKLELFYKDKKVDYKKAAIMSVPCVLHGIASIQNELGDRAEIEGVEMELSTYYYFGQQTAMNMYSFIYVSDNPEHHLLNQALTVKESRYRALNELGRLLIEYGYQL